MQTVMDILTNIGFDWRVALANLVNFIIIFWLLDRFIFGIVKKSLKKRKETIKQGVEDAQKAETALVMAEEEKKGILKEAYIQANSIAADAFNKAKQTVNQSVKDAQSKADGIIKDAQKDIDRKRQDQEKELEKKAAHLVVSGMEKALRDNMTPELQEKIVKNITA